MPRNSLVPAVLAALLLAGVAPAVALAANPVEHLHVQVDSFRTDICGISLDAQFTRTDTSFANADGSFKDNSSFRETLTNPLNGRSVMLSAARQLVDAVPVVDQAANTITFDVTYTGLAQKIQTDHGPVLLRDVGIITFRTTFDFTTGEFISQDFIVVHGPHPSADRDSKVFCDVITDALG